MFEWDDNKSAINLKKHGISFKEASLIFNYSVLSFVVHQVFWLHFIHS